MAVVPHSVYRLTALMVRAVDSDVDPRTMSIWGSGVHLTAACVRRYSSMAGVRGLAALALTRATRAYLLAREQNCAPGDVLDIADSKTLARFLGRAGLRGLSVSDLQAMTLERFLSGQQFVTKSSILASFAELLASRGGRWES